MRKWTISIVLTLCLFGCNDLQVSQNKADGIDSEVDLLLSKMTLEEKVGQMTQLTLEVVTTTAEDGTAVIDAEKLREALLTHHVGSIFNCGGQAQTLAQWHTIISQIQDLATEDARLGIPVLYGIDSIHGVNYTRGATVFPQNIAMAATGNSELLYNSSEITALETRASGIPWNFNPVLGLARQPLWSRFYETYGEDPYLVAVMGKAYVEAQQGDDISDPDRVAACMKHYLGYSVPLSGKDRTPAIIPDRQLRQTFLKPFAAAAKAGVVTVMVNSSEINGIPVHASPYYLQTLLREELGFKGFVVSDWADIKNLFEREKVAASQREAVKIAVMAGIDMSMVPYDYSFCEHLIDLVRTDEVPMARIDEAVTAILRVKFQLGLFDDPYPNKKLIERFATEASTEVNLQAAREAITLLENDGVLPLSKSSRVLVTGPCADALSVLNGGWTITWQGNEESLYPQDKDTILEAVQKAVDANQVSFVPGVSFDESIDIDAVVEQAMKVDVVIACLGEPAYCETPGDINDLTLSQPQLDLMVALADTGKPVVVTLTQGRPRVVASIVEHARAIVLAYLPGMEGGRAIADVLFGDANPSGKLPFTYPKYNSGFMTYDHKPSEAAVFKDSVQWEFGHGLSYTQFAYRGLTADRFELTEDDSVKVTVEVTNTGQRAGKEIVQVYLSDLIATVTPPVRRLQAFKKIELEPGKSKFVEFVLRPEAFRFIGADNKPVIEPGDFKLQIGELEQTLTVIPKEK